MPDAGQVVEIEGRRVRVTNLDKVMYPDTGTTKGEVIDYYTRIAPRILPWLAGRPVTRKRWVHGVGTTDAPGEVFFAKQLETGAPQWVRRLPIEHSGGAKEYPIVDGTPALVWLAQLASIELHVPQWRFAPDGSRSNPDRLVLDLDPGRGVDLAQCAHVARLARAILRDIGLDPEPVTSGSKGIHLYSRLDGRQTSDAASAIAKELARALEADHPDIVTSTMAKASRGGRVFLDWSQNNASKTTISPYSLRGRERPTVAAPRTWAELDDPALRQLLFDEVLTREDGRALRQAQGAERESQGADRGAQGAERESQGAERESQGAERERQGSAREVQTYSPMLATAATPGLIRSMRDPWAEIKWDGIRAIGTWQGGRLRLRARSGTDITARYPELTADGAPGLAPEEAVVDGEIVAFDDTGRPSFGRLQRRMHLTRAREIEREVVRTPVALHLFDLLRLDGRDLTGLALRDRRALLERLGESADAPVVVPPVFEDVDAAEQASRELGLEGIVVKASGSRYRPGSRSGDWLKVVHIRTQEVVIAGIRPGNGERASTFGSLLLGVPDADGLRYVGRVGTGFDDRMLRDLTDRLTPLRTDDRSLHGVPDADAGDALWVRPEVVGEVAFSGWTAEGSLRHPRWRGVRGDKDVGDITAR